MNYTSELWTEAYVCLSGFLSSSNLRSNLMNVLICHSWLLPTEKQIVYRLTDSWHLSNVFTSLILKSYTPGYTHVDLWAGFQASGLCRWGPRSEGTQRWVLSELHKILHGVHWKKGGWTVRHWWLFSTLFWVRELIQSFSVCPPSNYSFLKLFHQWRQKVETLWSPVLGNVTFKSNLLRYCIIYWEK